MNEWATFVAVTLGVVNMSLLLLYKASNDRRDLDVEFSDELYGVGRRIQAINLNPGDGIVITIPMHITKDQKEAIRKMVKDDLGVDVGVLVLGYGMKASVIGPLANED